MTFSASYSHADADRDRLAKAMKRISAGQIEDALIDLDLLLAKDPRNANALTQLGLAKLLRCEYEDALVAEEMAIRLQPSLADAHSYRGSALLSLGRFDEALQAYDTVIKLAPKAAVAHYNRGNALRRLGRLSEAETSLKTALRIDPSYANAFTVLGMISEQMGDQAAAQAYFNEAIRINPNAADAHYNKGLSLLADGKLLEGWHEYEWRLAWQVAVIQGQSRAVNRIAPDWQGEMLERPLLVLPEQGLGDQIFFSGILPDLQERLPGSFICTVDRLIPLLTRSFDRLHFISVEEANSEFWRKSNSIGAQIHIGSLGKFFRSKVADFSRVLPSFLKSDPELSDTLGARMRKSGKLLCGLSWTSKNSETGKDKSLTLESLLPVLKTPGIEFVNLQYGDTQLERQELLDKHGISLINNDDIDNLNDIDTLAALIDACDFVISVSNTTAHIAAGLGKPALILLSAVPGLLWYWHRSGPTSPWYPSVNLLRQSSPGNWSNVLQTAEMITASLAKELPN